MRGRFHRFASTALLGSIGIVVLIASLLSATTARAQPQAPDRELTVMTFNIHHAQGTDDVLDLTRIAEVIRASGADVIGLQEVDRHWSERSDFVDQASWLARELGMHVVYGANLDRDPVEPGQPRRQYGTAILSRYPILESRNTYLPRSSTRNEQRGLLEALINVRGVPVWIANTHLQHNSAVDRTMQVEEILRLIGERDAPVVLMGDINARPDAPEIQPLYTRFVDAWIAGGDGGDGYTYAATGLYQRIDYIFVSPEVTVEQTAVLDTAQMRLASDHLPVVATILLPGEEVGVGHGR